MGAMILLTMSYAQRRTNPQWSAAHPLLCNNNPLMMHPSHLLSPLLPCFTYLSLLLLRCTTRAEGGELKVGELELEMF